MQCDSLGHLLGAEMGYALGWGEMKGSVEHQVGSGTNHRTSRDVVLISQVPKVRLVWGRQ